MWKRIQETFEKNFENFEKGNPIDLIVNGPLIDSQG